MSQWGTKEKPWPIAVSDLDAFDQLMNGIPQLPDEYQPTDESFLRRLDRLEETSAALEIGKALHDGIEQAMYAARRGQLTEADKLVGRSDECEVEFNFARKVDGQWVPLDIELAAYNIIEQDHELVMHTPSGWVQLRGRIDGLRGIVLRDLKSTKKPSAERYQDSWQWRAYLEMMGEGYSRFEYHVFQVAYGKKAEEELAAGQRAKVGVVDYGVVTCHRYPQLRRDLQGITAQLATYLETIGWEPKNKRPMQIF